MKAMFLNSGYLSGVQTGLQAGHCIDSMWSRYTDICLNPDHTLAGNEQAVAARPKLAMLRTFARDHRTFVILNGGDHASLGEYFRFLNRGDNPYPWTYVNEPGLNNALTSVGIILPEKFFGPVADRVGQQFQLFGSREAVALAGKPVGEFADYSDFELELLRRRVRCGRAT